VIGSARIEFILSGDIDDRVGSGRGR